MQITPSDFFPLTLDERKTTVTFYSILLYNLHISLYTSKKKKKRCPDLVSNNNKKKLMVFKLSNGCSGWVNLYGGKKPLKWMF